MSHLNFVGLCGLLVYCLYVGWLLLWLYVVWVYNFVFGVWVWCFMTCLLVLYDLFDLFVLCLF